MSYLVIAFLATTLGLEALPTMSGADAAPVRALILSGSNNHDWRQTTPTLERILQESGKFTCSVTEDPGSLRAADLEGYDLIVSNWNNWPSEERVWGEEAEKAVMEFVRAGKGFALFHAASACFGTWSEYQKLVGATWDKGTTGHGVIHEFPVMIIDRRHPVTRGLSDFRIRDELWHKMAVHPDARVLATAFSAAEMGGTGKNEPVAFATQLGAGRGFYLVLGHDATAMEDMDWRVLMLRGCEWAATGRVTITWPIDADLALSAILRYKRHDNRAAVRAVEQLTQWAAVEPAHTERLAAKMRAMLAEKGATDDCKAVILQQLSLIGSARDVVAIARLVGQERLGDYALGALQRIPGPQAEMALLDAVKKLRGLQKIGAINALGERRSVRAVPILAPLVRTSDDATALAAISALGRIGGERAIEALQAAPQTRQGAAADALLSCAMQLSAEGKTVQATSILRQLTERGWPNQVRTAAFAELVGSTAERERIKLILDALRGDDVALQAGAGRALRALHDLELGREVAANLPSLPLNAQAEALNALRELPDSRITEAALELLRSPEAGVRIAALRLVAFQGGATALPMLLALLRANPTDSERAAAEEAFASLAARTLAAGNGLGVELSREDSRTRASILRALGRLAHPAALELAASQLGEKELGQDAAMAVVQVAERLPAEYKAIVQSALEKAMAARPSDERLRTRARTVLIALGVPVDVTRSAALQNPGPNLALGAIASSPDDIDSDGASGGDQAGIDGNPTTYWDEVNDQPLYRFRVTFPAPTEVSAIRITGYQQHLHSPKDFDILCDDRVVLSVKDAWYESNQFAATFPSTTCTALELRITGSYGPSPAIRELEVFASP